ncbi:hypothetical protein EGH22_16125 [Halomicroarcula sp. F28]|uniref:hypothetical protein n=1 Tax=Haloarcula salinisoli TaxID=2487746 RepID=UPI001C736789|nr:hypothetical protein [Halomicroarcula salinisoli]MBX0287862.1 hypothetical protein [Halomicroarcula salinisoli]
MLSRENQILLGCGALAVLLSYTAAWLDLPGPLVLALLLGVGVVLPFFVNERPDVGAFLSGDETAAERE